MSTSRKITWESDKILMQSEIQDLNAEISAIKSVTYPSLQDVQDAINSAISSLINSSPQTLDTLAEIATALNNDANFASTITTALASKQAILTAGTGITKTDDTLDINVDNSTLEIISDALQIKDNGVTSNKIVSLVFSKLTGLPTTLAGYGITDTETISQLNIRDTDNRSRTNHTGTQTIATITGLQGILDLKQDNLVSGINIKTVNNESILGNGNILISSTTNLSSGNNTATSIDILSDTGTDATINSATITNAGLLASNDKIKLNSIEIGATINSQDSFLLNRVNHTGVQEISTINNLQATLDNKLDDSQISSFATSNHTHLSNDITDLQETIEDFIGSKLTAGANITINYNDTTGQTTISSYGGGSSSTYYQQRQLNR